MPRFQCRGCRRTFSRQTFRADYRDHKPSANRQLIRLLCSGLGLRRTAIVLGLARSSLESKFHKIAAHVTRLNATLRGQFGNTAALQFDEFESYEGRRNTRPLTIPFLIHETSRFHIAAISAPIRPRGKMSDARRRAIRADERRFGVRRDRSRQAILKVLEIGAFMCGKTRAITLRTDEKPTYPRLARLTFGSDRLTHETTNGKVPRTPGNPLFPINHSEAMARDRMGRLRRDSWLTSKSGARLDQHLAIYCAYRNYVRTRFNHDSKTPAQILGFVDRPLNFGHLTTWRQDWGRGSIHPLCRDGSCSVSDYR